jgi:hypothetical protein
MEESGLRVDGGAWFGAGRALSRSRETTVELLSDSEYADRVSGQGKAREKARQPGRDNCSDRW